MALFRKLPVTVEAVKSCCVMIIKTLEGDMLLEEGDWLITGVNGEQYPCKDEIFRKTYEPVDEEATHMFCGED